MYKPSEYATLTGMEIEKLLKEAGIPENVFHTAIGAGSTGERLLELPFDGYFFTGSYKTGKYIYEKVSHKMVPCQCELGGKDPLYVTDDIKETPVYPAVFPNDVAYPLILIEYLAGIIGGYVYSIGLFV
jgi:acyl-CoA reductase-like NAD-dependent aldehyde dehydrogenase